MYKYFAVLVASLAVLACVFAAPGPAPAEDLKASEALYYSTYGVYPYAAAYRSAYPGYGAYPYSAYRYSYYV